MTQKTKVKKSVKKPSRVKAAVEVLKLIMKHKKGLFGLTILIVFVLIAVFADVISPHSPDELGLADRFAVPIWFKNFPQYKDLPENLAVRVGAEEWNLKNTVPSQIQFKKESPGWLSFKVKPGEDVSQASVQLEYDFEYPYSPPKRFEGNIPYKVTINGEPGSYAKILFYIVTPKGKSYLIYDSRSIAYNKTMIDPPARFDARDIALKLRLGFADYEDIGEKIFSEKGTYKLKLEVIIVSVPKSTITVDIGPLYFRIPGLAYGILGTDNLGADLFANLIYGTRVSLLVGILASIISVSIGLVVGIVAGYKGGIVDQILTFFTDTLLFMPVIPLLIAVSVYIGKNLYLTISLIALLSWMGFARNCRAFVMSLRERLFVEAAKAVGASDIYIIFRHILPQLTPLIYITLVLNVPGAILLEAALSFLNLGDPSVPSWGRMLYNARYSGAFFKLMWWWIIPPGIMITLLAMSFILIGQTLDEVFNPKLKARR